MALVKKTPIQVSAPANPAPANTGGGSSGGSVVSGGSSGGSVVSGAGTNRIATSGSNANTGTVSLYSNNSSTQSITSEKAEEEKFQSYEEWVRIMREKGYTHLTKDDFSSYVAGLSQEMLDYITKSDQGGYSEADKVLQSKVGNIYKSAGDNDMDTQALAENLRANGLEVEVRWSDDLGIKTGHKVDNLAGGGYSNSGIDVLIVKDPETGAEIRIADTNGNGAIELEEVFFNEIITGVSNKIDTAFENMVLVSSSKNIGVAADLIEKLSDSSTENEKYKDLDARVDKLTGKMLISQSQYNEMLNCINASKSIYQTEESKERARQSLRDRFMVSAVATDIDIQRAVHHLLQI